MMIDYYYYRLGSEKAKTRPLTRLRFDIAYGRYLRDHDKSLAMFADAVDKKARLRLAARWAKLAKIAALVHRGKIVAGHEGPDLVAAGFGAVPAEAAERQTLASAVNAWPTPGIDDVSRPDDDYRRPADDGPFPDAGAPGVREPRRPIAPLLVGAGALSMPMPGQDAPAYPSWMST